MAKPARKRKRHRSRHRSLRACEGPSLLRARWSTASDSQLIYGLMICFVCFGAYVHFDPYEDRGNDAVARLCQMQIFFSLLASVALTSASEQNAGSNMDILLVVLYCLPVRLPCALALGCSPLTPASVMPVNAGWAGDIPREPAAQGGKDATPAIDAAK